MKNLSEARAETFLNIIAGVKKRSSEPSQVSKSTEVIKERHINTRKKSGVKHV